MIQLEKSPTPQWLLDNAATQTARYIAAEPSIRPTPWRNKQLVDALRQESHGKCIYCEGAMGDLSYAAVEHIAPKSLFPELVLDWQNLGLVCQRCNTAKSDYWTTSLSQKILNPYVDAVDEHLDFIGPIIASKLGSTRGENSVRKLRLKREDLVLSRMRRIQDVELRLVKWYAETDDEIKELLAEDVRECLHYSQEFSASLRSYAASRGFPV
jgi:uncharacterized protein (TIGR02646 family)